MGTQNIIRTIIKLNLKLGPINDRSAMTQCYTKAKMISFLTLGIVCIMVIAFIVSTRSHDQSTDRNSVLKEINRRNGHGYQGR